MGTADGKGRRPPCGQAAFVSLGALTLSTG
jgi:hypothetical protein